MPQVQVLPIHFEDYSGAQFERLACAYLMRQPEFSEVEWYGQLGSDRGRDIVCVHQDGTTLIVQCANYRTLTERKVREDIEKIAGRGRSAGAGFRLIAGGNVSAGLRDKIAAITAASGLVHLPVWSGAEFEERLRRDTPDLLQRFVRGEVFPELTSDLASFAANGSSVDDETIVQALTLAFDRPAFRTPFAMESSLPRFKQALGETIQTLNTGYTTTGRTIPSKNDIRDAAVRASVDKLVERVAGLRHAYDRLVTRGEIQRCGCDEGDCPVHMLSERAVEQMDKLRETLLGEVKKLNPHFIADFYRFD